MKSDKKNTNNYNKNNNRGALSLSLSRKIGNFKATIFCLFLVCHGRGWAWMKHSSNDMDRGEEKMHRSTV